MVSLRALLTFRAGNKNCRLLLPIGVIADLRNSKIVVEIGGWQ
jgi:hypothetical protein